MATVLLLVRSGGRYLSSSVRGAVGWLESLKPLRHSQKTFEIVGALLLILSGLYLLNAYFVFIPELAV